MSGKLNKIFINKLEFYDNTDYADLFPSTLFVGDGVGFNTQTGSLYYAIEGPSGVTGVLIASYNGSTQTGQTGPTGSVGPIDNNIILVGIENTLASTYDGINWTLSPSNPFPFSINQIAWNGSSWVMVGNDGIMFSSDGINWVNSNLPFDTNINGICWGGNIWVCVGGDSSGNTISFSYDGLNWTFANNPFSGGIGLCVEWNGKMFVAGAENTASSLAYSYNGIVWNSVIADPFSGENATNLAWSGFVWVATGFEGVATSNDGINWDSNSIFAFGGLGNDVKWNGTMFIVSGGGPFTPNTLYYSYGGASWVIINTPLVNGGFNLVWNGNIWLATGSDIGGNFTITYSSDGINWLISPNNPFPPSLGGFSSRNVLPYVGQNLVNNSNQTETYLNEVIIVGTGWLYSYDNINWTNNTLPIVSNDVAWNGILWVAVGNGIIYSSDGLTWTTSSSNPFSGGTGNGITWNGSIWSAVGTNGNGIIVNSVDGINWTDTGTTIFQSGVGNGIATNGVIWVANGVGTGCNMVYSSDGIIWNSSGTSNLFQTGYGVAWNGVIWIATGINNSNSQSLASSSDGINWSYVNNNPFGGNTCFNVAWNGNLWVAVGNGSTNLVYSMNGLDWNTSTNNPFSNGSANDVVWNGTTWIVVGVDSNSVGLVANSSDGMNWTISNNNYTSWNAISTRRLLPNTGINIFPAETQTIHTNSSLTGNGTSGSLLSINVQTDSSLTGNGTSGSLLTVDVQTDSSLTGHGTSSSNLAVFKLYVSTFSNATFNTSNSSSIIPFTGPYGTVNGNDTSHFNSSTGEYSVHATAVYNVLFSGTCSGTGYSGDVVLNVGIVNNSVDILLSSATIPDGTTQYISGAFSSRFVSGTKIQLILNGPSLSNPNAADLSLSNVYFSVEYVGT